MINAQQPRIDPALPRRYVERFNALYPNGGAHAIEDRDAADWIAANVPLLTCSDPTIEEIYYFRWWTYRKHIRNTPDGFVVSEFVEDVGHAGKHNTINCPVGHQLYEGRWIKERAYLDDYSRFMLYGGGDLHQYSCWFADAVLKRAWVQPDDALLHGLLPGLQAYYAAWEQRAADGLFHYTPWMDGMEYSVSGNLEERFRPTLNSYMYGDALAIAAIARSAGTGAVAAEFDARAAALKANVQARLWNADLQFFATRDETGEFMPAAAPVREAVGFIPWYFNLPDPGYEAAWQQLSDPAGFCSPVGLTSAEIRHPQFLKVNPERLAAWDGAIWPYATSQTLTALQNVLRNYEQPYVTAADYVRELRKYAASHVRDGKPSVSEVVRDPFVAEMSGAEHYNHSTFCDLIITGLAGIVPRPDDVLEISPLVPETWDYFCLTGVSYRDHPVTIVWDRDGSRCGAKGFQVYVDDARHHAAATLSRVELPLDG